MIEDSAATTKKHTEDLEELDRQIAELHSGEPLADHLAVADSVLSLMWTLWAFGNLAETSVILLSRWRAFSHTFQNTLGYFVMLMPKTCWLAWMDLWCLDVNLMYVMWRWISLGNSVIWNLCILQRERQNKPARLRTKGKRRRCQT